MSSLRRTFLLSALVTLAIIVAFFSLQYLRASIVDNPQGFILTRLNLTNNQCPTLTQKITFWNDLIGAKMTNDTAFDANGNGKVTVTDSILLSTAMVGVTGSCGTPTCDHRALTLAWADTNGNGILSDSEIETHLTTIDVWLQTDTPDLTTMIDVNCDLQKNDTDIRMLIDNLLLLLP